MTSTKIDLCYVVSFGFSTRMLLQTELLRQLEQTGLQIAIITPDIGDGNLQELARDSRIQLYEAAMENSLWNEDYLFKRKYYLEDIKANPALWEKHVYSLRYSKSKHPWRRLRPLYYLMMYHLIKLFPVIRSRFQRREKRYLNSPKVSAILERINPQMLVATYPVNILEAQVMYAAKIRQIPIVLHLLSWDNITCKGRFPVTADYYIAWGEMMKSELQAHYQVLTNRIHVCGVPHFDYYERFRGGTTHQFLLEKIGLNPQASYLFFAMRAERFAPKEIDIVEQLAKVIQADRFGKKMQLVVRPHPQNVEGGMTNKSWLKRLEKLAAEERVAVDWPRLVSGGLRWSMRQEDMNHLAGLLAGCRICLNSCSTISIEAQLLDKPVILTSFDADFDLPYWKSARRIADYVHLRKQIEKGGVQMAESTQELHQLIKRYAAKPNIDTEKRQKASKIECYQQDGKATERVRDAIHQIWLRLGNC